MLNFKHGYKEYKTGALLHLSRHQKNTSRQPTALESNAAENRSVLLSGGK